jgi:DeoR family suf operon transcriptional repressor
VLTTTLASLPTTRRCILMTLKRLGEARADELAEALDVTVSAMRQHLSGLMGDGLVTYREVKGVVGRPKHVYALASAAEAFFPKFYGELTNELLTYVEDEDPELLERMFARRRQRRIEAALARLAGRDLENQIAELTEILDEDGYVADWHRTDDGGWRIVEHNCAILGVAQRYGQACSSELEFIRAALSEATVERVEHMLSGARRCAYEVRPKTQSKRPRPARRGKRPATSS